MGIQVACYPTCSMDEDEQGERLFGFRGIDSNWYLVSLAWNGGVTDIVNRFKACLKPHDVGVQSFPYFEWVHLVSFPNHHPLSLAVVW